jgi:septum formation protein
MLALLSARTHRVLSAVTVANHDRELSIYSDSTVEFRQISDPEAQRYWETTEPTGKAGAYAIQGYGAVFVKTLSGSYSGVMGLPLFETAQLLGDFGVQCWQADPEQM